MRFVIGTVLTTGVRGATRRAEPSPTNGGEKMNEFLALAALIVFAATTTGALIAGVAHVALISDRPDSGRPERDSGVAE
jgi:hypothetical protein